MLMSRKTVVAFPQRVVASSLEEENLTKPAAGGGLRKELVEEQSSSSSSSESDSSSDSEEENDASEVPIKTKVEFPRRGPIFPEKTAASIAASVAVSTAASMVAKENVFQKPHKEYGLKKLPRKPEIDVSSVKQVKFSKTSVSQKTSKSRARDTKVKSTPKAADQPELVSEPRVVESQHLSNVTQTSDYLDEKSIGTQVAAIQLKASAATHKDEKQKLGSRGKKKKVKEAQESEVKEVTAPKMEETSGSTVLVMGTTPKEETIQEAGVQTGESSTIEEATGEPAPEEFDNSTYKNLQHHKYDTYTFADYTTLLSKYRQPQPSSGRPSPRH
ncbi:NDUV3 dehydrogenase, partial [Smithornis capensis]|nr:NDUV3 dehydrogenase [Smithornis capensis]